MSEGYLCLAEYLIFDEKYRNLSNDARVCFVVLKDKYGVLKENVVIDRDGNHCIKCDITKFSVFLNMTEKRVAGVLKELSQVGLIKFAFRNDVDTKALENEEHYIYFSEIVSR